MIKKIFAFYALIVFILSSYTPFAFALSTELVEKWQGQNKNMMQDFVKYSVSEKAYEDILIYNLNISEDSISISGNMMSLDSMLAVELIPGQIGVGRAEKERHAGMNQIFELYGRKDDGSPTDEAIGLDLGPDYQFATTKSAWIRVKPCILNAGKIKDLSYYLDKADIVLEVDSDGTAWIDCSKLKTGTYFLAVSCTHAGGMTTYHILVFAFKFPFNIRDDIARNFGIQDPNMILSERDNRTLTYSTGILRADGADVNKNHVPKIKYENQNNQNDIQGSNVSTATVKVYAYEDMNRVNPTEAQIAYYTGVMQDGKIQITGRYPSVKSEFMTINGSRSIDVNAEYFKVVSQKNDRWQIKLTKDQEDRNERPYEDWWKIQECQQLEINLIKDKR